MAGNVAAWLFLATLLCAPGEGALLPEQGSRTRREERFLLYTGEAPVGLGSFLRTAGTRRGRAGVILSLRYLFPRDEARVEHLLFHTPDGGFGTYYYRAGTPRAETILRGHWEGGTFHYVVRRGLRTVRRTVPLAPGTLFPPAWAQHLRRLAPGRHRVEVWDPRSEGAVRLAVTVTALGRLPLPGGERGVWVVTWSPAAGGAHPRGSAWVGPDGRVRKAALNGRFLVAVATARTELPPAGPGRPDRRELRWLRARWLPGTDLFAAAPAGGWISAPEDFPGARLTLVNRELEAVVAVFAVPREAPWPGPPAPGPWRTARLGPGPGETAQAAGPAGRERLWLRGCRGPGRVVLYLEAPADRAPAAAVDLAALAAGLRRLQTTR